MHKVFVYGTLRPKGKSATHILYDYTLYNYYDRFPFVLKTLGSGNHVNGNIIEVDDQGLLDLDRYENLESGLYTREKVRVFNTDNLFNADDSKKYCYAWCYIGSASLSPTPIASGDWFNR